MNAEMSGFPSASSSAICDDRGVGSGASSARSYVGRGRRGDRARVPDCAGVSRRRQDPVHVRPRAALDLSDRTTELMRTSAVAEARSTRSSRSSAAASSWSSVLRRAGAAGRAGGDAGAVAARPRVRRHPGVIPAVCTTSRRSNPRTRTTGSRSEVMGRLRAARLGASNVIEVAYVGAEPAWAKDFVTRLTQAYVERHASLHAHRRGRGLLHASRARSSRRSSPASEGAATGAPQAQIGAQAGQQDGDRRAS